jgi:hypothetical protein
MEERTCRVKIIVNGAAESCFTIRFAFEKPIVNIKIIIKNKAEIYPLLEKIRQIFPQRFRWNLEFNWKITPMQIQEDREIRQILYEMFTGVIKKEKPESLNDLDQLATFVKAHIEQYHQAPDMSNLISGKQLKKIHNYICSITSRHDLTISDVVIIAKKVVAI